MARFSPSGKISGIRYFRPEVSNLMLFPWNFFEKFLQNSVEKLVWLVSFRAILVLSFSVSQSFAECVILVEVLVTSSYYDKMFICETKF